MMSNSDCLFKNKRFNVSNLNTFNSEELSSIVGQQHPDGYIEDLTGFNWIFKSVEIQCLRLATQYNEEPENGWSSLYLDFLEQDNAACIHSPEYAGRDKWIKSQWTRNTNTYPLYVIVDNGAYRLLDGYHRLVGAFYYGLKYVSIILGNKI